MENNFFENAQKLIHEHDELVQFRKDLENINTNVGIIYKDCDGPGLCYKTYSDDIKDLIKESVDIRLCEIEKQFN